MVTQFPTEAADETDGDDGSVVSCEVTIKPKYPKQPVISLVDEDVPDQPTPTRPQATPSTVYGSMRADPAVETQNTPTAFDPNAEAAPAATVTQQLITREPSPRTGINQQATAEPIPGTAAPKTTSASVSGVAASLGKKRKRAQLELDLEIVEVRKQELAIKKQLMELDDD